MPRSKSRRMKRKSSRSSYRVKGASGLFAGSNAIRVKPVQSNFMYGQASGGFQLLKKKGGELYTKYKVRKKDRQEREALEGKRSLQKLPMVEYSPARAVKRVSTRKQALSGIDSMF